MIPTLQRPAKFWGDLAVAMPFLCALFLPLLLWVARDDPQLSALEKRTLASRPAAPRNMEQLERYPERFEQYFADNFGFRERMTKYYKVGKYLLGDSPSPTLTLGKEGWMFLGSVRKGGDGNQDPMGDARNLNLYSSTELERVGRYFSALDRWLARRGIRFLFVLTPSKSTVYPEYLPDYIEKASPISAADQLFAYLAENTRVEALDLRGPTIAGKHSHQLFFRTDTHWNAHGANIGQYQILRKVEQMLPGGELAELRQIDETATRPGGDLSNNIDPGMFPETDPQPVFGPDDCVPVLDPENAPFWVPHTTTCDNGRLNAVLFVDSFFIQMAPFTSRKFHRATYIWARLDFEQLEHWVEKEHPDIVIEQWAERALPYAPEPPASAPR